MFWDHQCQSFAESLHLQGEHGQYWVYFSLFVACLVCGRGILKNRSLLERSSFMGVLRGLWMFYTLCKLAFFFYNFFIFFNIQVIILPMALNQRIHMHCIQVAMLQMAHNQGIHMHCIKIVIFLMAHNQRIYRHWIKMALILLRHLLMALL